jgi:hypothetical protein
MNTNRAFAQAVDYQKTLVDNSFSLFASLQEQGQKWVDQALESNSLVPESGREIYTQWVDYVKQNNEICKSYVESSLDRVRDMFAEEKAKPAPPKAKPAKKSE